MTGSRTRAVASLGIVLGLGAIGTLAAWSDTATATSGVFSTGSVSLTLNGNRVIPPRTPSRRCRRPTCCPMTRWRQPCQ
ncbi:hypothetical protein GS937_02055 [Rhodococcus hoagii]|nr:hypothetical protein [Prescottella equi]